MRANRLRKRRLEREVEETEDWFRNRARQQAAEEAVERRQAAAERAEQWRQGWRHEWTEYALNSMPFLAPREIRLDVHAAVEQTLASLDPGQPDHLTQRLVDAAVAKALRPRKRKEDLQRAIESAMGRLPAEVRYVSENAGLKQRAWEAAAAATLMLENGADIRVIQENHMFSGRPCHSDSGEGSAKSAYNGWSAGS